MRVTRSFGSYNPRRYSKPWIGVITSWPVGGRAEIRWGSYLGDDHWGEAEVEAEAGDIVRWGQKDFRGNNTISAWGIVQADGSIKECDAAEARKAWDAKAKQTEQTEQTDAPESPDEMDLSNVSDAALIAEIRRRGLSI